MKNKFSYVLLAAGFVFLASILMYSCKKDKVPVANKEVAFFATPAASGILTMSSATNVTYKIPVGLTKIPAGSRTVNVAVASPSGASAAQYALSKTSVTFTPDHISDTIVLTAVFAQYQAGRKDTLKFSFSNTEDGIPSLSNTFTLFMRGPCFEGDVVMSDFGGAWKATEVFGANPPYGPYNVTVTDPVSTGATTGKITVNNVWDNGWGPLSFTLDWTDPANRILLPQDAAAIAGSNAGDLSSTYAGQTIAMRAFAGSPGTFSWCNGTLTLKMQLGVTGVGYFGSLYTVTMVRP